MATQSNLWFAAVPPGNVPVPSSGYYAFFVGDGTGGTTAGVYYRKDSSNVVTALVPSGDPAGSAASAQAAAIAASQPRDQDLTDISALTTTTYGRALLTVADQAALNTLLPTVTQSVKGLMTPAQMQQLITKGVGVYNVLDYGIATANTGAVNLSAWNTLMSGIPDNSEVFFPPSPQPYQFSGTCVVPAGKHLIVKGAHNQKSMIQTTSATADIFQVQDWYQEFNGLKFTSSVTRTAGAAINSGNNVQVNVQNCDFAAMWDGIVFTGGNQAGNLALVSNCGFTGTLNRGIVLDGKDANTIIEKVIMDGPLGVQQVGLELNQCGSVLVSNCDLIRSVNNLRINTPAYPLGVFSAYFINTFFDTSSAASVLFTGTGAINRVKFTNCWFSGSATGCDFNSTSTTLPTAIDFIGCDIFGNSSRGIYARGVQDFSVTNCRIAGNTTAGIELTASAGSVTRFNLTSNTIGPTAGFGANGTGVLINAGTYGGYSIKNNDVRGNTTQNITDGGTVATTDLKVINDNMGHIITGSIGNLAVVTNTSGVANTSLLTVRVPPNAVAAGQVFRFKILGISSSTGTLIFRVHAGTAGGVGDPQVWQSITSAAQVANQRGGFDGLLTVRTAGSGGTVQCEALGFAQALLLPTLVAAVTTPGVNTAGAWFITLAATASAGLFAAQQAVVEAL